jgi:hypothetical protein
VSDVEPTVEEVTSGPTVFISYRRADTGDLATSVSAQLRDDLGSMNVFRDQDDLIVGDRWQETLDEWMAESDAAVFLVGVDWPGLREDGTSRMDDEDDPVRNEVLQALRLKDAALPLPFLIDLDDPPRGLPDVITPLFSDHHFGAVSRHALEMDSSSDYQRILVGIWNALRRRVPGGVLIVGERDAMASLDALVSKLRESGQIEARELSRFASGAYVVSVRKARKLTKRWPDVIVNIEQEEPTEEMHSRLAAIVALPGVKTVTLVGTGAAAGLALGQAIGEAIGEASGSSPTLVPSSVEELATGLAQPAVLSTSSLQSAWSTAGLGAKIATVAAVSVVALGGALAVIQLAGADPPGFVATTELAPFGGSDDAFPLGEPAPMTVNLGSPDPVSEEEAEDYFGNFPGGTAERRSVEIRYRDARLEFGETLIPVSYPDEYVERNVGVFRLTRLRSDGEVRLIEKGAGASRPCVYSRTGEAVGGWQYTGDPGVVTLDLLFESDGTSVTDVGMRVTFDGPANIVFFEDMMEELGREAVEIRDRCTPVERMETEWRMGIAESQ